MLETHPFGDFVPAKTQYLLLGSFTGKIEDSSYDWFYTNKRNQFWSIIESTYGIKLKDKKAKQKLFTKLFMAMADIIYQCERKKGSNLDNNLTKIVWNTKGIEKLFKENHIKKVFFSSRFVETHFRKLFPHLIEKYITLELITLPSPSPRYAKVSLKEKISKYKELLPKLK